MLGSEPNCADEIEGTGSRGLPSERPLLDAVGVGRVAKVRVPHFPVARVNADVLIAKDL